MKTRFLLIILLLSGLNGLRAQQNEAVTFDLDDKVIYLDSLHLAPNYSMIGVLHILPDILNRPGNTLLKNYEVKIDKMSLGNASDAALSQLSVADVETIKISESPEASYANKGQGGTITLMLRNKPDTESTSKNTWGSLSLGGSYPCDITPHVLVNNQFNKFLLRTLALGEYYDETRDGTHQRFWDELVTMHGYWDATPKDAFKFFLTENVSHDRKWADNDSKSLNTTVNALVNYKHTFSPRTSLTAECQSTYGPGRADYTSDEVNQNSDFHTTSVAGKVELTHNLLPDGNSALAKLIVGTSANGNWSRNKTDQERAVYHNTSSFTTNGTEIHAMPYVGIESAFRNFRIKGMFEYQYYHNRFKENSQDDYIHNDHEFTAKLMAQWAIKPNHVLRLMADRKIQRPTDQQVYPFLIYNPDYTLYVQGNNSLHPTTLHELSLDYLANFHWNENHFTFHTGVSYTHIDNMIWQDTIGGTSTPGTIGMSLQYLSYLNEGNSNQFEYNLMTLYRWRWFSLSATANLYHYGVHSEGDEFHYTYYNLSLLPSFNLPKGWDASAAFYYHSAVQANHETTLPSAFAAKDCAYTKLSVGKRWGNWHAYVFGRVALHDTPLITNNVGLGFRWQF